MKECETMRDMKPTVKMRDPKAVET